METYRDSETGKFVPGQKPHNAGLSRYFNSQTSQVAYFGSDPGEPWIRGARGAVPPSHKNSHWYHNPETGEKKRFKGDPGEPWSKGRGKTGTRTTNGMRWYHNPSTGETKVSAVPLPYPWIDGRGPRDSYGWVEGVSRAHCRRWDCDSVYLLKMTTKDGIVFGKWGSSRDSTFAGREKEFKKKGISWELLYWGWFGGLTEDVEAFIGRKLSEHPAKGIPKFYGHTETFEWSQQTQKLLKEICYELEENPPS
jgi:hypothetical protein